MTFKAQLSQLFAFIDKHHLESRPGDGGFIAAPIRLYGLYKGASTLHS